MFSILFALNAVAAFAALCATAFLIYVGAHLLAIGPILILVLNCLAMAKLLME